MRGATDQQPTNSLLRACASKESTIDESDPSSLKELLEVVNDFENSELNNLRNLADQLKSNPQRYLVVHSFEVKQEYRRSDWDIYFSFKCKQAYSMWKTCSLAALFKLHIDETALSLSPSELYDSYEFKVSVSLEETKNFLRFLQPLANYTHFEKITIEDEKDDIVQMFCQFLRKTSVNTIEFYPRTEKSRLYSHQRIEVENFASWFNLVRILKPSRVIYVRIDFTQELIHFLGEIADLVESIWICGNTEANSDDHIISIILGILRRKCKQLRISHDVGSVSSAQIEQMIQYFKSTDQKVTLTVPTDGGLTIGDRIGEYELKTSSKGDMVVLQHISIQSAADDQRFDTASEQISTINSSELSLSPAAKCRKIEFESVDGEECGVIKMLNIADERRKSVRNVLIGQEQKLRKTTNPTDYVIVDGLDIRKESDWITVSFSFCSFIVRRIWCSVFDAAAAKVALEGNTVITRKPLYSTYSLQSVVCIVPVSKLDEFEKILKYMRPLISKTHFKPVKVAVKQPEILRLFTHLLEGSSAEELRINAFDDRFIDRIEIADFSPWLDMIRRVRPFSMQFSEFHLTEQMMNFLILTAAEVNIITLKSSVLPVDTVISSSFLKEIFSRRCTNFNVWDSVAKITEDQVEKLLKFFHHLARKVCLTISVSEPVNEARIGAYTVEMIWNRLVNVQDLVIRHFDALQYEQNWW